MRGMCSVHTHLPWEASGGVWGNQRNGFWGYLAKCLSEMHGQAMQSFKNSRTERKKVCWHLQAALDLLCVCTHVWGELRGVW